MSIHRIDIADARAKLENVFPPPQILTRLLQVLNDPDVNGATLEALLKLDPSFSAKLLSLGNSSYYGMSGKISSLRTAITLLGFNFIRSLAIQASVSAHYDFEIPGHAFSGKDLWKHSVGVAVCSKMLARRFKLGYAEDFFSMGILHDIGMIVVHHFYPAAFAAVLTDHASQQRPIHECEQAVLGVDHAALTSLLAEQWHLPEKLIHATRYHHQRENIPEAFQNDAATLALADFIVMEAGFGFSDPHRPGLDPGILTQLNISGVDLDVVREDFLADSSTLEGMLQ